MKRAIFTLTIAAMLAACGQESAGVGAGNGASSGNKTDIGFDKSKSIAVESASQTFVKMPASALISEALSFGYSQNIGLKQRQKDTNSDIFAPDETIEGLKFVFENIKNKEVFDEFAKNLDGEMLELVKKNDHSGAMDFAKRRIYERRFIACNDSMTGWEVSPVSTKEKELLTRYMTAIVIQCDFTNLIFTEIASKLSGKILSDPAEARESILETWKNIDIETIDAAWNQVLDGNKNAKFTTDLTGVKGVQFTAPNGRYMNEGGGFMILKNGVTWYGKGALSGKVVELSLRSTLSTKAQKSKTITNESGGSVDSNTGANINVK
jgi:hypothetical protein